MRETAARSQTEGRVEFTQAMKETHTILIPNMANYQFELMAGILRSYGYKAELLKTENENIVLEGLKYVHNDTCYPALLVIGQFIDALKSGKYDLEHTALMITQTGGGCRASNYIHLLRKALEKAGFGQIPVVSVSLSGMEKNSGFKLTLGMLRRIVAGMLYGDLLMLLTNQTRPYEDHPGDTDALAVHWTTRLTEVLASGKGCSLAQAHALMDAMADDFAALPITLHETVKVGIVGEIYVKYSPLANNDLERFLQEQDCEVNLPGVMGFVFYMMDTMAEDITLYGGSKLKRWFIQTMMGYYQKFEAAMDQAVARHPQFRRPGRFAHCKELVNGVIGTGNKMGEGWLLTGEMLELVESGFENIICAQPFGCLPNHICGKGMIRKITSLHPQANIVPIDYDPSATRVNQENRIKLMLSIAKERQQPLRFIPTWEEPVGLPLTEEDEEESLPSLRHHTAATF